MAVLKADLPALRKDPDRAERFLKEIFPVPEDYEAVISQLSTSLQYADESSPKAWTVSLAPKNGISFRLNVGDVEVLTVRPGTLEILVNILPQEHSASLSRYISNPKYREPGEKLTASIQDFLRYRDIILPYHKQFIQAVGTTKAGKPRAGSSHREAHSPSLEALARRYSQSFMQKPAGQSEVSLDQLGFDRRKRVMASIVQRPGQGKFRDLLLDAYQGRCAITGYSVPEALEAAHILPYRGDATDEIWNGLLLRADLHTLFDIGFIAVNPATMSIVISAELIGTDYENLTGRIIRLPDQEEHRPNAGALDKHRKSFGFMT